MKRACLVLALAALARPCAASVPAASLAPAPRETMSRAQPATGAELTSRLAPVTFRGSAEVPELWLAQRAIDREWGPSDDSTYRTVDVKGWKSEGLALALSSAVPGAGQIYTGEGSGWLYVVGEALGWAGRVITHHRGVQLRDQAAAFVGDPNDSTSAWSFARYSGAGGGTPTQLEQLWAGDRDSYYQALANDPIYRSGFAGADPGRTFESYRDLRVTSQDRLRQSRILEMALWMNHAVSAFDALRAARFHNLPLQRSLDLQVRGGLHRGEPQFRAALVRRF